MDRILLLSALMVESLVLVWVAKLLWGWVLKCNVNEQLTTEDNPAVAITLSGYFFSVLVALAGVMASPSQGFWSDIWSFGAFGLVGVVILFLSLFSAPLVGRVKLQRDIIENRNVSAALVLMATFVATGLIFNGAVRGEGSGLMSWVTLLVFQLLGQVTLVLMAYLFEVITPYDLHDEIRDRRNLAAAMGYAGALVAIGLILQNAVMGEFVSWASDLRSYVIYALPLLLLWPVRAVVVDGVLLSFRNLNHEIAVDRNVGAGVVEAAVYVGFALLFMAAA